MAYSIIPHRIQRLGFCCPYSYFFATRKQSHATVALELQCSKVSVRKWRKKPQQCLNALGCFLCSTGSLDQCRAQHHAVLMGIDLAQGDSQTVVTVVRIGSAPCPTASEQDSEPPY